MGTLGASLLRSAIGFAPLVLASIIYRNDHSSLLLSTRFFLAFSLAAAAGSLGLGAYIYSLNISSSSASSMSQRADIIAYIFKQINARWWICSAIIVLAILWTMRALTFSPFQIFFLTVFFFLAPALLVSTQYFLSVGRKKLFLVHTSLQSFVLVAFLPFAVSNHELSLIALIPLALVFLAINKYVSQSCLHDCLNRSSAENNFSLYRPWQSQNYSLRQGSLCPPIALSTRLKCFADSFFPLAYTSAILLFFERLQSSSSESYQLLFYNYTRVSDAIVSLFVTFCTLSVSKKLFKLLDAGSGINNKVSSVAILPIAIGDTFSLVLPIFVAFVPCLCIGYAFNYLLLGSFSIVLISFDILISSLKLAGIFLSLYMLTRLPSLALASQTVSLAAVLLGAFFIVDLQSFLFLVAVALGFSSLFPMTILLIRARSSTLV